MTSRKSTLSPALTGTSKRSLFHIITCASLQRLFPVQADKRQGRDLYHQRAGPGRPRGRTLSIAYLPAEELIPGHHGPFTDPCPAEWTIRYRLLSLLSLE